MRRYILLFAAAAMIVAGCNPAVIDGGDDNFKELRLSTKAAEYIQKGNDFSLSFMEKINEAEEGSYVISPLSLQYLLGMILNGAKGQTADEICEVLGYGAGETGSVNEYCKSMLTQLPKLDDKTTLKIANAIMVAKRGDLLASYKNTVANYYEAYVESVDFSNTSLALSKINGWCNRNTNGLIPKILDDLSPQTYAVLMNALYFKSKWVKTFDKAATAEEPFISKPGEKIKQKMMKKEEQFAYASNNVFRAVRLPYGNGSFSMIVALPQEGNTVSDVIASLNKTGWKSLAGSMSSRQVQLWLPKFESKFEADLTEMLSKLGMPTAFGPIADFSAMTKEFVCIDMIKQKAIIKVDEEGSEAAAVSIGVIKNTSVGFDPEGTVIFHADHPFLYFITENSSGAILFAGRYNGK
ncbi:MAG: serpin family protein [Bacteroidales bacterium]|nr:serpin family protein [Bacteroidales bacterium]